MFIMVRAFTLLKRELCIFPANNVLSELFVRKGEKKLKIKLALN